jgi:hypothetical protein
MQLNARVKSDQSGHLRGNYQCIVAADGLQLQRKKQTVMVIPRGTRAHRTAFNQLTVELPTGPFVLNIGKFASYQGRLIEAIAAFLRGERDSINESEFKIEPYLLAPAVLPFGIMIVTRGGAIWGGLGGIIAVACIAVAQLEAIPRIGRLAIILLINVVLYALIISLVHAAK